MRLPSGFNRREKILIFGGAFDPIHRGHRALLKNAHRRIKPDQTLVIPSSDQPVHKNPCLFPAALRVAMIESTLKGWLDASVIDYEIKHPAAAFTWNTLNFLKRRHPKAQFYLVIGSDNVHDIRRWKNARELLGDKRLTLVAANRPGWPLSPILKPFGGLIKLRGRFPDISSSEIRDGLINPDPSIRRAVINKLPPPAKIFLDQQPMMTILAQAYVNKYLPPARARHSESVARLAQELALQWGADQNDARLAGLLHDASRTTETFANFSEAMTHAQKSAALAKNIFRVKNPKILEAISSHTLGRPGPGMGLLAQILYIADFASDDRDFPEAQEVRTLAQKNLSQALCLTVSYKLRYLLKGNQFIHPKTIAFWNNLVGKP